MEQLPVIIDRCFIGKQIYGESKVDAELLQINDEKKNTSTMLLRPVP